MERREMKLDSTGTSQVWRENGRAGDDDGDFDFWLNYADGAGGAGVRAFWRDNGIVGDSG